MRPEDFQAMILKFALFSLIIMIICIEQSANLMAESSEIPFSIPKLSNVRLISFDN